MLRKANEIFQEVAKITQAEKIFQKVFEKGYNPKLMRKMLALPKTRNQLIESVGKEGVEDLEKIAYYGVAAEEKVFKNVAHPLSAFEIEQTGTLLKQFIEKKRGELPPEPVKRRTPVLYGDLQYTPDRARKGNWFPPEEGPPRITATGEERPRLGGGGGAPGLPPASGSGVPKGLGGPPPGGSGISLEEQFNLIEKRHFTFGLDSIPILLAMAVGKVGRKAKGIPGKIMGSIFISPEGRKSYLDFLKKIATLPAGQKDWIERMVPVTEILMDHLEKARKRETKYLRQKTTTR